MGARTLSEKTGPTVPEDLTTYSAQEGNDAASLYPLDLVLKACATVVPRSANCGRLMPPGAAFCPVFGGAFTVRFVTFSVVMGDGTDLNVTAAIGLPTTCRTSAVRSPYSTLALDRAPEIVLRRALQHARRHSSSPLAAYLPEGASCPPPETPCSSGSRGSPRCLRGGTTRRCSPRPSGSRSRSGSSLPPRTAVVSSVGCLGPPSLPIPSWPWIPSPLGARNPLLDHRPNLSKLG